MVFFFVAAAAAFLMFFLAAARCLAVAMMSLALFLATSGFATLPSALLCRALVFLLAATAAALFPTAARFIYRCPSATLRFILRNPPLLIAFFDVFGFAFLLARIL
jgi:hypothetical protein